MKGIASILVVLCHISCVFLPGLHDNNKAFSPFEKLWLETPFNVFTNGNTAVQFFFVVSGFLIARGIYIKCGKKEYPILLLKRYLALLKVVVPAVILSFILMQSVLMYHLKALQLNQDLEFVIDYNNFSPSVINFAYDLFINPFISESRYVGPLWTIKYEFLGSILTSVIAYYSYYVQKGRIYMYVMMAVVLAFGNSNLCPFMFGAFVYDVCYMDNSEEKFINLIMRSIPNNLLIKIMLLFLGIYLSCCNIELIGMYNWVSYVHLSGSIVRAVGVTVLFYLIIISDKVKRILEIKPLLFLGNISGYIYAFHWQIILSLGCWLYIVWEKLLSYYAVVAVISLAVIVFSCLLSYLYMKFIYAIKPKIKRMLSYAR